MSELEGFDATVQQLASLAKQVANIPVPAVVHASGRSRVMAHASSKASTVRRLLPGRVWAIGGLAAAATLAIVVCSVMRSRPMIYEINGGYSFDSGYVSVPTEHSAYVRFSDGSVIEGQSGTRLRVEDTRSDGARVVIERGQVRAQIHHGPSSAWQFIVGPFEVRVVGTRFVLGWEPAKEQVDITLEDGAVEVKSPLGRGPFVVRKGQHFQASLLTHSVVLGDAVVAATQADTNNVVEVKPAASAGEMPGDNSESAPVEPHATPLGSSAPPKSNAATIDSWSNWVSRGRFQEVVAAAEASGIERCLGSCSLNDVRALADAARYTHRADLAERSLLAIRQRAAGGPQREAAAFLLGRTNETSGRVSVAYTWYQTYLAEAPNGEFAADSLAGALRATVQLRGNAAARPLAMQYLQRYPNGVHSATARKIVRSN